ncbi:hypothetical protein KFK09_023818 [Dendrobium nobile]|uniref:Uncharacterized protein n=1 Tax=Dendrobium nobile TaxID=94219 RepID=A0A8T3ACA6_DENNO|nr:hypothetical protein KFK09_023818 [Dendrobium nobile]
MVKVSALNGENVDELLETVMLVAEMQELKANPHRKAKDTCTAGVNMPCLNSIDKIDSVQCTQTIRRNVNEGSCSNFVLPGEETIAGMLDGSVVKLFLCTNSLFSASASASDQAGLIWLASVPTQNSGGTLDLNESNIFLDLTDMVHADTAFGVMGLAFHPNFTKNGHFFISFHCDKVQVASCSGRYQSVVSEFITNSSSSTPSEATSVVRLAEGSKSLILQAVHDMSTIALRCLGVAYKDDVADVFNYDGEGHPAHKFLLDPSNYAFIESDLIFAGMVGLRDPIREEVYQAIEDCKAIGIRVMSFGNFQEAILQEENIENKVFDPGICLPPYFPSN